MNDITVKALTYKYTIEFQKRVPPHVVITGSRLQIVQCRYSGQRYICRNPQYSR